MEVIVSKGRNKSHDVNLNFLAKTKNIYLMDNHLAAFWCWSKELNSLKEYTLTHIDRHDDLSGVFVKEAFHLYKTIDFANISINSLLDLKINNHQMLRWDNFIEMFNAFNPFTFNHFEFVTPKSLPNRYRYYNNTNLKKWISQPLSISELTQHILKDPPLSVLNFDVDVLFTEGPNHRKKLTKNQMIALTDKLRLLIQRAELVTIALSPECCGGWNNSIVVFNHLNELLELGFDTALL